MSAKKDASRSSESVQNRGGGILAAFREDPTLYILSALLLVAMGCATLYHLRYARIDETVIPGSVEIDDMDGTVLAMHIDDDMQAEITYRDWSLKGTLALDGAEEDTVLYKLNDAEFTNDTEPEPVEHPATDAEEGADSGTTDAEPGPPILLVRVPRSGLQGDHTGPWMVYFTYTAADLLSSDWVFIEEGGKARVGNSTTLNPMTMLRKDLMKQAQRTTWERVDGAIVLDEV